MSRDRACEALEAQGFEAPGPKLIEHVMDAIAREEESPVGGERIHTFNYHELLADTPELVDRTEGPLTDGTGTARLVAGIINEARAYVFDDDDSETSGRRTRADRAAQNRRRAGKTLLSLAKTANVNKQKAKLNKEIKRGRAARQIAANTPLGGLPGRSGSRARHLVRAEVDRSPARGKPQTDGPMINVLPLNLDDRPKPRVHHGKPSPKHAAALKAAYAQLGKPYPYD